MGVVYEGTAPGSRTDQRLAIKVVRSAQFASPEQLVRFRQEIASLARIRHDNVCRLIDFGHEGPIDYLVMEYVNGRAFDDWLEEEQPETGRIAQVVAKVARAIDHIHTQGIIHRDLNAHNVMVDADDRPVVMDFGLAHDVDGDERITASGVAIGTPSFMSPEATLGKKGTVGP
jgi:serine/threonine protein kinase